MSFQAPPLLEARGNHFVLRRPLVYIGNRETITVPEGFVTDLGSVPWYFSWLVSRYGEGMTNAYILHDWLYRTGQVSRKDADGLMRRIMREEGVSWIVRKSAWLGVRAGGWIPWRNHRKRDAA